MRYLGADRHETHVSHELKTRNDQNSALKVRLDRDAKCLTRGLSFQSPGRVPFTPAADEGKAGYLNLHGKGKRTEGADR